MVHHARTSPDVSQNKHGNNTQGGSFPLAERVPDEVDYDEGNYELKDDGIVEHCADGVLLFPVLPHSSFGWGEVSSRDRVAR